MKRRIGLSIALGLSVLALALISSDATVKAQPKKVFVFDTGLVTLGSNQVLRITVANGPDPATVRIRRLEYTAGICDGGGVCKHVVSSETTSDQITLAPGEATSQIAGHETSTGSYERFVVTSNRNMRANALIIGPAGEIVSLGLLQGHGGDN